MLQVIDMNEDQSTTIVSVVSVLGKVLDHYGLDKISIAKKAGIDVGRAYKPDDRVGTVHIQKAWKIAQQQSADDCIGLTYAKFIQPAALSGLGLAWITSDSLKDSIRRLVRFQHALTTAADISFNELDDCYQIIIRSNLKHPVNVSIDATVASLYQMCRITYGPELVPERVCIAHARPGCASEFDSFFGVHVEFDSNENQIIFSKNAFERSLATSNPDLARMNDQIVIDYLKQFDKKNISMQVRAHIIEELNCGVPHQEKIADVLNLSLRNLQRKLKDEGTCYKDILDETRTELAMQYLRGSDRSIIEIGFLLGFSESSNFSRAFRRWTGQTPQEYRLAP